jgi:hypothetical protein
LKFQKAGGFRGSEVEGAGIQGKEEKIENICLYFK